MSGVVSVSTVGWHEVPDVARPATAGRGVGAGDEPRGQVAEHLVDVRLGGDQRAHLGGGVEPRAHVDLRGRLRDPLDDLRCRRRAGCTGATWRRWLKKMPARAGDAGVAMSASLESTGGSCHRARSGSLFCRLLGHDHPADLGRAREGDLVDAAWAAEIASAPKPGTMLITPAGNPASRSAHRARSAESGVCSAGFDPDGARRPPARGPHFQATISIGKFHGMICPTTPTGSLAGVSWELGSG